MVLEFIVSIAVTFTGMTCAAHDNSQNKAVFAGPTVPLVSTTYTDHGRLIYKEAPKPHEDLAWIALHTDEKALQQGKPGSKISLQCITPRSKQ